MTAGKAAAQLGHAFVNSLLEAQQSNPTIIKNYQADGLGTKVCLIADHLHQLEQAYLEAKEQNLPCSLIIDSGHIHLPDFDGSPVVTALGIGPCTKEEIGKILKKFKLY
jgi:peptidyl-tRNA hydrolase